MVFYFLIFCNETLHVCRWAWKNNDPIVSLKSSKK
jgi:hypothetical protein